MPIATRPLKSLRNGLGIVLRFSAPRFAQFPDVVVEEALAHLNFKFGTRPLLSRFCHLGNTTRSVNENI